MRQSVCWHATKCLRYDKHLFICDKASACMRQNVCFYVTNVCLYATKRRLVCDKTSAGMQPIVCLYATKRLFVCDKTCFCVRRLLVCDKTFETDMLPKTNTYNHLSRSPAVRRVCVVHNRTVCCLPCRTHCWQCWPLLVDQWPTCSLTTPLSRPPSSASS